MALNQGKLLENLEKLVAKGKTSDFIYDFLEMYGTPKATTTRLKSGTDTRNVGLNGDVGLKKKLYFRASTQPIKPEDLDSLCQADPIERNDIRFVFLTDFERVLANDLTAQEILDVPFSELAKNYHFFLPVTGQYEKAVVHSEHPADLKASEKMGQLFDLIRERNRLESKEDIHALNVFLTRLLFCFYAEDTDIFKQSLMTDTIKSVTKEDGSDLDQFFSTLFTVLNIPENDKKRQALPAYFSPFPYVNGGLFEKDEAIPEFGAKARRLLIECGGLNWSEINPDIFGSMFQTVIDPEQRGNLGQHYTSVSNIMKVIQPLFLDKLYEELDRSRTSKIKLEALLARLQRIQVFDPACGSGNFLIIAYKELRKFEMEVCKALNVFSGQNVFFMSGIQLSQFYGIEIDDFAHEIAILSLWLAEHQMNKLFAANFGYSEPTLPLKTSGNIICANSLEIDWESVCPQNSSNKPNSEIYICGNPPFLGQRNHTPAHVADMALVFKGQEDYKNLDYVSCWLIKGARYLSNRANLAFVVTNSVCQGAQVSMLWPKIYELGAHIQFAYEFFKWNNAAKDNAGVICTIIGLSKVTETERRIYSDKIFRRVANVSPYITEGPNSYVTSQNKPISKLPFMIGGNQPREGGYLCLDDDEKEALVAAYPESSVLIKPLLGTTELLTGKTRWCLWIEDSQVDLASAIPPVRDRIEKVRLKRLAGNTVELNFAKTPHRFVQINRSLSKQIIVPNVSTSSRKYLPIGFISGDYIITNLAMMIPDGDLLTFGLINSGMHNTWVKSVAGRLGDGLRYAVGLCYNTFPVPDISFEQRIRIETLAEEIILVREDYPDKTLGDLYDKDKMPGPLLDAHQRLDSEVDRLYRCTPFSDASERLEHLFTLYQTLILKERLGKAA